MPSRLVLKYASAISSGWSHAMLSVSSFLPANAGVAISTAFSTIVAPALKIVIMVYSFTFAPMIFLGSKAEDRTAPTLEPSTKLRGPSFPTHDEATYAARFASTEQRLRLIGFARIMLSVFLVRFIRIVVIGAR